MLHLQKRFIKQLVKEKTISKLEAIAIIQANTAARHSIWNLKFNVTNETPAIFHMVQITIINLSLKNKPKKEFTKLNVKIVILFLNTKVSMTV